MYNEFGPPEVLHLQEVQKPAPQDGEILVKVHAASVNYGDLVARNFKNITAGEFHMPLPFLLPARMYFGFNQPKVNILGSEFAGQVEATGKAVTHFKKGDPVMAYLGQRVGGVCRGAPLCRERAEKGTGRRCCRRVIHLPMITRRAGSARRGYFFQTNPLQTAKSDSITLIAS